MKLKIISDGNPHGVKIVDTHTGAELEDIVNVHVFMDAGIWGGAPTAEITLTNVAVDLLVDSVKCKPVLFSGLKDIGEKI